MSELEPRTGVPCSECLWSIPYTPQFTFSGLPFCCASHVSRYKLRTGQCNPGEVLEVVPEPTMDPRVRFPAPSYGKFIIGKKLTDRKIGRYEKRGFYSKEFRQQRREYQAKKKAQRTKRVGNFIESGEGRFIYSPL